MCDITFPGQMLGAAFANYPVIMDNYGTDRLFTSKTSLFGFL
jgi:dihydroxyacid dehydratase/phosphogluconate dehydratase